MAIDDGQGTHDGWEEPDSFYESWNFDATNVDGAQNDRPMWGTTTHIVHCPHGEDCECTVRCACGHIGIEDVLNLDDLMARIGVCPVHSIYNSADACRPPRDT